MKREILTEDQRRRVGNHSNLRRSRESLFKKVATHLITQGQPSMIPAHSCRYRATLAGVDLMCAAGCLIPNSRYSPEIEGSSVRSIDVEYYLGFSKNSPKFMMVVELQDIHDSCSSLSNPAEYMKILTQKLVRLADRENFALPACLRKEVEKRLALL